MIPVYGTQWDYSGTTTCPRDSMPTDNSVIEYTTASDQGTMGGYTTSDTTCVIYDTELYRREEEPAEKVLALFREKVERSPKKRFEQIRLQKRSPAILSPAGGWFFFKG